ncbi:MAG: hypothetical protein ACYS0C_03985 [Planctomycetota bacterium]|jgi:hypothetical protein
MANNTKNPKAVRVWAEHSDLKTTMGFYSQVTEQQATEVTEKIGVLLKADVE